MKSYLIIALSLISTVSFSQEGIYGKKGPKYKNYQYGKNVSNPSGQVNSVSPRVTGPKAKNADLYREPDSALQTGVVNDVQKPALMGPKKKNYQYGRK